MAINSETKLVNLGNLQTFKTAYDTQVANLYLSKEDFLNNGIIKSEKLPSYVDDVIEVHVDATDPESPVFYADDDGSRGSELTVGEKDKIYVDLDATIDGFYRWSGTRFVAIGTSVSTADKAVKDGNGNTITATYATKTELSTASTTPATTAALGVVKIGSNIDVDSSGVISVAIASAETLGVVKAGENVSIDSNGVISAIVANTDEVNGLFGSGD